MEVYFCDLCFYKLNSDYLSSKIKTLAKNERQKISISVTREIFRASKKSTKDPDNEKKKLPGIFCRILKDQDRS